jgi:hypothetical protein
VLELKQKSVNQVYLDVQDEMSDILRLTCIEAGIHISDTPNGIVLKADEQGYQIISETVK